jgi:VanZ family protein
MADKLDGDKEERHSPTWVILCYLFSVVLLVSSIFIEATLPPTIGNATIPHLDKLAHFFAFGLLAFLLIQTAKPSGAEIQWGDVLVVCVAVLGFTVADEVIQIFNTTRQASLGDIGAGCLGAFSFVSVTKIRRDRDE